MTAVALWSIFMLISRDQRSYTYQRARGQRMVPMCDCWHTTGTVMITTVAVRVITKMMMMMMIHETAVKKVPFHLWNQMKKKRLRCAQHNRIAHKQFVHGQAAHTNSLTNYTAITSLLIKSFYSREESGSVRPLRAISHTTAVEAAEWGVRNEITFSCTKPTPISSLHHWEKEEETGRGRSDIKRERKMKKWRLVPTPRWDTKRCRRAVVWSWSGPGVMSNPDCLQQMLNSHTHTHT